MGSMLMKARDYNWKLLAEIDDAMLSLPTTEQLGSAKSFTMDPPDNLPPHPKG